MGTYRGTLVTIHLDQSFAFVRADGKEFDRIIRPESLLDGLSLKDLTVGDRVRFRLRNHQENELPRPAVQVEVTGHLIANKTGTFTWFNPDSGFGFIQMTNGPEVWCHSTALADRDWIPEAGDPVRLALVPSKDGKMQAAEVILANSIRRRV